MIFAERLQDTIVKNKSVLIAGLDPQLETLPDFILARATTVSTTEDGVFQALTEFYEIVLTALPGRVAGVKPNIAFFEQYGIGGLRAFSWLCAAIRERKLPLIIDAKRGDIGHTATAYSRAFLGRSKIFGKEVALFDGDAVTVNPFLGFDTVESYFDACREYGKGIFVLVKTSNPGSGDIQGVTDEESGKRIYGVVAEWISKHSGEFKGSSPFSGLGAVVGATYPEEAKAIRELIGDSFLLIPGFGAQGASAEQAVAGFKQSDDGAKIFGVNPGGGVINVSRGLFQGEKPGNAEELRILVEKNLERFNGELAGALKTK